MIEHLELYSLIAKDIIEIACLSTMCYWSMVWLNQDRHKPLLIYGYLYALFWIGCFLFDLNTLTHLLELTAPVVAMLFILIHQKTLQKNFIGLYKVTPAHKAKTIWLEELIRFCLQADQDVMFLVEHKHALADLLTIEVPLNTQLTSSLLAYLSQCTQFNQEQYILLDTQGMLHGINTHWQKALALYAIEDDAIKKATYYLQEVDAFALYFKHTKRTFTLILKQQTYPGLNATQVMHNIDRYLKIDPRKKGTNYVQHNKATYQQPHA